MPRDPASMDRREFLRTAGAAGAGLVGASLLGCQTTPRVPAAPKPASERVVETPPGRMPVVFTAHGTPMNAVNDNEFTRFLEGWAAQLPTPKAICCISAHFEDLSPVITAGAKPEIIYDYYNFPERMYELQYPAPGAPALAERTMELISDAGLMPVLDAERGLDHGCWAPLLRTYPKADIPVYQVAIYIDEPHRENVKLGAALAPLRDEGVLIYCSGNVTHSNRPYTDAASGKRVDDWGRRFDGWVRKSLDDWDLDALCDFETASPYGRQAHPTTDHFEPLLVACGAAGTHGRPTVTHAFEGFQGPHVSMRCVTLS